MKLREPKSMEELVYMTNRSIGDNFNGSVRCWVFKEKCPKCGKALMGKPSEDGHVKIRAEEYVCPSCGHAEEKQGFEDKLTANIEYTCPKCQYHGQIQMPFKRKKVQGVSTLRFQCEKCKEALDVTKKMKQIKKKGSAEAIDE